MGGRSANFQESPTTKEQKHFLAQAVSGLAEDGKVVCVRLALFAEMMKGKTWTPATLKEVGGTEGVGVTFLEETFSALTAPPEHRYHQKAARAVLKALLPDSGTDIKGHMRSYAELLAASGYLDRPKDFHNLIGILDGEIRLITPTDPEGKEDADPSKVQAGAKYYQLTHDYLVPSLRDWLTRKQRETRKGRAELRLAERSMLWNAKPENRYLPSLWEFLNIRLLTDRRNWTEPQRKMMGKAGRVHGIRSGIVAAVLVVACIVGTSVRHAVVEKQNATRAEGLVDALVHAPVTEVPSIVIDLGKYRAWTDPLLKAKFEQAKDGSNQGLNMSLALLPVDESQVNYLYKRLLTATPDQVAVIVAGLADHKAEVVQRLWSVLDDPNGDTDQLLRAASALAAYTPEDARWKTVGGDVAAKLVTENSLVLGKWIDALRPVSGFLAAPLADIIQDEKINESRKIAACEAVAAFAAYDPTQFQELEKRLAMPVSAAASDEQKIILAKQQANVAVALLRMNQYGRMREVLKHSPDPTARSYLIHRFNPLAIDPKIVWKQLQLEKEVSVRRALILGLGELAPGQLVPAEREAVISQLIHWYRDDPDPGMHGATEWLLRHWKQDAKIVAVTKEWVTDKQRREQCLQHIGQELATGKAKPQWYVTSQGQTMIVIPGPVEFMGGEPLERKRIALGFAIAAKDVTIEQYGRFRKDHQAEGKDPGCPFVEVSWYDAAAYCNWLSEQEGIPENQWCYEPNAAKSFAEGMKIRVGRQGYRLPSEWEWEYACRAGSVTDYCCGKGEELLGRYAWYAVNSVYRTWPVGTLKPNDLGLFDVHGNVWQWCQNGYGGEAAMDSIVQDNTWRVLRGGSFDSQASNVRSADRPGTQPVNRFNPFGFRPARTYN